MSDETSIPAGESHLEAAKAFFGEAPPAAQKPAETQKPAAPEPQKGDAARDPFGRFMRTAEPPKPADAPPAATEPEDPYKGLAEPDAKAKHRPDWDKLKGLSEKFRTEAETFRKEVETLKSRVKPEGADEATTARLKQLEEENKRFSERLQVLDLENHPEFDRTYRAPQREAKENLRRILEQEEVSDVDIDALLSLKGKELAKRASEVIANLTEFNRQIFADNVRKFVSLSDSAKEALKNSGQTVEQIKQKTAAQSRAQFDAVGSKFNPYFLPAEVDAGADEAAKGEAAAYNAALSSLSKTAEKYAFSPLDGESVALVAHKAAAFDFTISTALPRLQRLVTEQISSRDARIAKLESEIASMTAARPRVDGGGGGGDAGGGPNPEQMDHKSAARLINFGSAS